MWVKILKTVVNGDGSFCADERRDLDEQLARKLIKAGVAAASVAPWEEGVDQERRRRETAHGEFLLAQQGLIVARERARTLAIERDRLLVVAQERSAARKKTENAASGAEAVLADVKAPAKAKMAAAIRVNAVRRAAIEDVAAAKLCECTEARVELAEMEVAEAQGRADAAQAAWQALVPAAEELTGDRLQVTGAVNEQPNETTATAAAPAAAAAGRQGK